MANIIRAPCDEGVILARASVSPCTKTQGRWVLAATILASSMAFIDGTVVNVALPFLQKNLNATVIGVQWDVEAYSVCWWRSIGFRQSGDYQCVIRTRAERSSNWHLVWVFCDYHRDRTRLGRLAGRACFLASSLFPKFAGGSCGTDNSDLACS